MKKAKQPKGRSPPSKKQARLGASREFVPAAMAVTTRQRPPRFLSSTNGVRVCHSELANVYEYPAVGSFQMWPLSVQIPGMDINPGVDHMFPWLSSIAANFERYRFNSLNFKLVPAQATSASGRVYMAIDYDYADPVAITPGVMMSNHSSVSGGVWTELSIDADVRALHGDTPAKYVSRTRRVESTDPRLTYGGYLMVAADSASTLKWDLWVSYDVDLLTPQRDDAVAINTSIGTPVATTSVFGVDVTGQTVVAGKAACVNLTSTTLVPAQSPVKELVPGAPGVPSLKVKGTSVVYPVVHEISRIIHDPSAVMSYIVRLAETGVTPANVLLTDSPAWGLEAFDESGNTLGVFNSTSPGVLGTTTGPGSPGLLNTAGSGLVSQLQFQPSQLLATVPTAKFLAPMLLGAALSGAGTLVKGFTLGW